VNFSAKTSSAPCDIAGTKIHGIRTTRRATIGDTAREPPPPAPEEPSGTGRKMA
jgi:hypothetical protein